MSRNSLEARLNALLPCIGDWTAHGLPSVRQLVRDAIRDAAKALFAEWFRQKADELLLKTLTAGEPQEPGVLTLDKLQESCAQVLAAHRRREDVDVWRLHGGS